MRNHLFFLSTDRHASPFDVNIALDSGFDVVIPYSSVKDEDVQGLTHDIIFSRGPKGAKRSGIFVGGSDMEAVERVVEAVSGAMFEPFTVSVFSDPKGAFTTAAALVAKVKKGAGGLSGKKAVIFGGTGPVGGVAAALLAGEGAQATIVTSRSREDGERAARSLSAKYGVSVSGAAASTEEERIALMDDSDIAIATVKAGVQVVGLDALKNLSAPLLIADVNAVPPSGFGGLQPGDDMSEVAPGVLGIGALAIGVVKYKVEAGIFKAMTKEKIVAGYSKAYELAQTLA